jgi:hypothetical protein
MKLFSTLQYMFCPLVNSERYLKSHDQIQDCNTYKTFPTCLLEDRENVNRPVAHWTLLKKGQKTVQNGGHKHSGPLSSAGLALSLEATRLRDASVTWQRVRTTVSERGY